MKDFSSRNGWAINFKMTLAKDGGRKIVPTFSMMVCAGLDRPRHEGASAR